VGTQFTAEKDGYVTGIRFWKTPSQTGTHTATLWSSRGAKLATAEFTDESGSGWQIANFAKPVALEAGTGYVASYFAPSGGYAATYDYTGGSVTPSLDVTTGAGVFRYGEESRFPTYKFRDSQYWVDVVFASKPGSGDGAGPTTPPTSTPTATPTDTPSPTATPEPTSTPTPTTPPTTSPKPSTGFPDATNTGVPAGTALTPYTGSCTITAANTVIDAKTINCGTLEVRAKNVVISRSQLNGTVYADIDGSASFVISDSNVDIGAQMGTGIGDAYFTATRVHVTGGNRSINCFLNCVVTDSYVHGQFTDRTGVAHESGIRMGSGSVIRHNTISCDAPDVPPDAGCSAALTGYGDFAVVKGNVIDGNQFLATTGGYCAYGGSTAGKPYSSGVSGIVFTNNVFQRGSGGKCGYYGAITAFDTGAPGNVWSNNTFDDGKALAAAN
jgi:hypothetical protein